MTNKEAMEAPAAKQLNQWATWFADGLEDTARAVLQFVPNGFNAIYNDILKRLPLLGKFFAQKNVETGIKFCTGITITQELGNDVAYFLFRPIGFGVGYLLGLFNTSRLAPQYQGNIGRLIAKFSGQTVLGALLGLFISLFQSPVSYHFMGMASGVGALLGLFAKSTFLFALHSFQEANALAIRKNVQKAKEINSRLKVAVREKAKSRILMQAQDIIQQMNGPQSQQNLAEFFQSEYDKISQTTHQKIERHFNYLADRACHGDMEALKRLQQLVPIKGQESDAKSALETMLDRMFNARAIAKIKDEVDSAYDRWQYRFLKSA
ncbi:MAG: hypothetical protein AB7I18_08065 [Candidatus Berkiella sp.]